MRGNGNNQEEKVSLHDYQIGAKIPSDPGTTFYGVIQAAMRMADTDNLEALQRAFPHTYKELKSRYNAPGGILPDDPATYQCQYCGDTIRSIRAGIEKAFSDHLKQCRICGTATTERDENGRPCHRTETGAE
jgi:hypothetical protein